MRKERIQYILPESVVGDVNLLPEVNGTPQNLKKNNEAITLGTLGNEAWLVTGSLYPTAPEEGSSTNILVWPNKWDSHIPLSEISLSDLVAANIYNTKLLKLIPGSVVTYSISSDSRGITGETRKALGSSIRTFHFHTYVDVEGSLINTSDEGTYKSLREPFSNELAQITQKYFQENMNIPSEVELVDQKDIAATIFPYANRGGVVFLLDSQTQGAETLSKFMLELDSCYTSFHKLVMQLFFSNYSDVSQSDWQKEYKPRETHVAQQAIEEQNFLPESTKMLLKRAAKRIQLSDNDKLPQALKVFRSPTYSVGIIPVPTNKKDQIAVVVNPHFYSMRSGGLQTLGVEVPERVRLTGVHPLDTIKQRQRRAEEIHQQLVQ